MTAANPGFGYDVAIIGGGSAGYAAARTAAAGGLRVIVIEGGAEVGGLCILRGCMPTKALLYAAEVMHLAKHAETWGIRLEEITYDFARVMARKDALVKEFADYRHQQLLAGKFEFRRAHARFSDPHTLELSTGDTLTAKHFVIATGSRVGPPPLPQLEAVGYLTSDTALRLTRLPKSLVVLGGGAVAAEFAQFFVRFGVQVSQIQRSPRLLHQLDADVTTELEHVLRREGIKLYTGTTLSDALQTASAKEIVFEQGSQRVRVAAEEIFYALGRIPDTGSLGLAEIGVELERGRIVTNDQMQTNLAHIYAAGDCTGPYEIVHIAVQQGEVAGNNIAIPGRSRRMDYRLLIEVIFTEPQIAIAGLTETQARARNIPYLAASYPFNDHGKALIMGAKDGFVKLLADPVGGEILGGACVGPVGGELIHELIAAMHKRMTVHELAAMPHYHPTLAEIWTYPAEDLAEQIGGGEAPSTKHQAPAKSQEPSSN